MSLNKITFAVWSILLLAGCNQDPTLPTGSATAPVRNIIVNPTWLIEGNDLIYMTEGQSGEAEYTGFVETPGKAVLKLEEAPPFLVWDEANHKLRWSPNAGSGNDPDDVTALERVYNVKFVLSSDVQPQAVFEKEVKIIVRNVPQDTVLATDPMPTAFQEGALTNFKIQIANPDFPDGPFQIVTTNLPDDVVVSPGSTPREFVFSFQPKSSFVLSTDPFDSNCNCNVKDVTFNLFVVNPGGHQSTAKSIVWKVYDRRLAPFITAPANFTTDRNVSFMVFTDDQNGDSAPSLQVKTQPTLGTVTVTSITTAPNRAALQISYTNIPQAAFGTTQVFELESCVEGVCSQKRIEVQVVAPPAGPPPPTNAPPVVVPLPAGPSPLNPNGANGPQ